MNWKLKLNRNQFLVLVDLIQRARWLYIQFQDKASSKY